MASEPASSIDDRAKGGFLDGFLTAIERVGNMVPHPGIIFFILIGLVIVLSVILSLDRLVGDLRGDRPGRPTRSSPGRPPRNWRETRGGVITNLPLITAVRPMAVRRWCGFGEADR